ncbi:hypothetical protein [Gynuella sp.]|uniref:hypothetical protein n=1 Tax=Gynuella sp. TaxID=2969146 RepID=UPI003D09D58F
MAKMPQGVNHPRVMLPIDAGRNNQLQGSVHSLHRHWFSGHMGQKFTQSEYISMVVGGTNADDFLIW